MMGGFFATEKFIDQANVSTYIFLQSVKSNIDTSRTADINFSCLLCLCRQRLQKIDTSSILAFLGYFDYRMNL